ncbi:hypothetical protein HETIRDRAFT_428657 [Heterobasidion irregulare TC 32-1]|uniref:DUF6589 domain-containing protein n=1 Tax=Heterobasidion irregulare (strain TC 32-1) TaxID=747525 RepID=W4K1C0_HETIT|nr:uncharacterized protein HETIRDRAFT_428657 [Heterobasidion irregulare TC 32-1]ETW78876.1 hypothetical protein HETIRDRAFT_428657 [Heterobasidion irregulare TC 32-1]
MARAIDSLTLSDLGKVDFYTNMQMLEFTHFQELSSRNILPSLQNLLCYAKVLATQYSTNIAYKQALRLRSALNSSEGGWDIPIESSQASLEDAINGNVFQGDWTLANSVLLLRDGIWSLEVCQAIATGDIGHVWEVFKVWIFTFVGAGNHNYMQYLLEIHCNIKFKYSEATRITLFNNWLVNLKGEPGHFHKLELMQEHFNFWLEELTQHKGKEFGDEWYRHMLAMHIYHFLRLKEEMKSSIPLVRQNKGHTHMDIHNKVPKSCAYAVKGSCIISKAGETLDSTLWTVLLLVTQG